MIDTKLKIMKENQKLHKQWFQYHIQVWSNLAQWFLRKRSKCDKLKDDRHQTLSDGKSSLQPFKH
jgi:hypothetical protein